MSARELAEWQAMYQLEADYQKLIADRVDPQVAFDLVYGTTD